MNDLSQFLVARIAEDESVASRAAEDSSEDWSRGDGAYSVVNRAGDAIVYAAHEDVPNDNEADHIARFDPTRVLSECDLKRSLLTLAGEAPWLPSMLVQPYADHPDFNPEWARPN